MKVTQNNPALFFATLSFTYSPHHRARKPLIRLGLSGVIFYNNFRKARMCWENLEVFGGRVLLGLSPCRLLVLKR